MLRYCLRAIHQWRQKRQKRQKRLYESWDEAAAQARASGYTYDTNKFAEVVARNTVAYRDKGKGILCDPLSPMLCRTLWALELCRPVNSLNVLDFGGAAGQHYFEALAYLPEHITVRWHVVETEAMVRAASVLATVNLRFFSQIADAISGFSPDIVFSSGALQCMENPLRTLQELLHVRAPYLYLSKGELCARPPVRYIVGSSYLEKQGPLHVPRLSSARGAYALTIVPVAEFEESLQEFYKIDFRFNESELRLKHNGKERSLWRGYFCRLRI